MTPQSSSPAMNAKSEKPDFSNVKGTREVSSATAADFGNVSGGFRTGDAREAPRATYTVRSGDSLSKIAHKTYGHSKHWRLIFDANRDQLDNPDLIQPGQVLVLPPHPAP
jgi:nucleoid-associated protein YgaU